MSKPRTQTEIDQWNSGARQADESWALQTWERGPGTQYVRERAGTKRTPGGGSETIYQYKEREV